MKASLLISTYNWPQSLELILESVLLQTKMPNEVVVADDGSKEETTLLINKFKEKLPVPLLHVWQPDDGFRASEIRNKAIAKTSFPYIIQIDGDTVLHKDFVKDHCALAEKGCFISGSRVLVGKATTEKKIAEKNYHFSPFTEGIVNRLNAVRLPFVNKFLTPKNQPIEHLIYRIRGCNMSFWREDLIDVNGYDQAFVGWGREDSELVLRLLKKGLKLKRIKMAAIQYHLYHKENDRKNFDKNHEIMMQSLAREGYRAERGIQENEPS